MRTHDITSLTEHRRNLRQHLDQVRETGRPIFVTTNGHATAVVMSPERYDELADLAELAQSLVALQRSQADLDAGRTRPLRPALRELAAELGLTLPDG